MPDELLSYIPFERVDRDKREIWGWATTEQIATDGKVLGFEAMCAAFQDWIPVGNVRELHAPKAVARAFAYEPDPQSRRILVGTRVSRSRDGDDVLIKAEEGILRGFSVKGRGLRHEMRIMRDGAMQRSVPYVTQFAIQELSYVDAYADPGASFTQIIRADGLIDSGTLAIPDDLAAEIARANPSCGKCNGEGGDCSCDSDCGEEGCAAATTERRDFTAAQRKELAAKGHALPDGSYPIETKEDVHAAVVLAQSGHGNVAGAKALIKRRAKALGATDMLPDDWTGDGGDDMKRSEGAQPTNPTAEGAEAPSETPIMDLQRGGVITGSALAGIDSGCELVIPIGQLGEAITAPASASVELGEPITAPANAAALLEVAREYGVAAPVDEPALVAATTPPEPVAVNRDDAEESPATETADIDLAKQAMDLIKQLIAREAGEKDDGADEGPQLQSLSSAVSALSCFISGEAQEVAEMARSDEAVTTLQSQLADAIARITAVEERQEEIQRSNPMAAQFEALVERMTTIENSEKPGPAVRHAPVEKYLAGDHTAQPSTDELTEALAVMRRAAAPGQEQQVDMLAASMAMRQVHAQRPLVAFQPGRRE